MRYHLVLARHCGAVLMGKKPAALFTLEDEDGAQAEICALAEAHALAVLPLRKRRGRVLMMVYAPGPLAEALTHSVARRWLERLGYPVRGDVTAQLAHLESRMGSGEDFPHEIGFFLGYPPPDVLGFIWHGGKRCKYSGLWKVYGDVEKAKRLCREYAACNALCCRCVEQGGDLAALQNTVRTAG